MIKCKICGKEYNQLSNHISVHNIKAKEYYNKYLKNIDEGICLECGKPTSFISMYDGYSNYCSAACVSKNKNIQNKKKKNNLKKYGVEYTSQLKENRDKYKKTCLERYGVSNPSKTDTVKQKKIIKSREKYGVDNPNQSRKVRNKYTNTCMIKYGVNHYSKTEEYLEKCKYTWIKKYNYDNPMKSHNIIIKIKKILKENMYKKIKTGERTNYKYIPLFTYDEFKGVHHKNKYPWFCLECSTKFKDHIDDGHIPRCPKCYPIITGFSQMEKDIVEYIQTLGVVVEENNRTILSNNRELDIYIPSHNLAIEFDGLYWHSELNGKDQLYHLQKTQECEEKGIQLVHIFEDEWLNKPKIIKSMIRSKLGLSKERIYARKCELVQIPFRDARLFFNENHIQGCGTPSKLCFGLMYDMNLVAVASFSIPRYNKKYEYELVRYATKRNTSVVGGFSKLMKHFIRKHSPKTIVSYADRRYSTGNVYNQCGFKQLETSKPNYFYIEENLTRSSRVKYQKHKLSTVLDIFDPNITEWQNMQLNGYDRIWDCGNLVFLYETE